jgi:AcrR family transcriptional regulator
MGYAATGRTRQKARTRAALMEAARAFLDRGEVPTVEQTADRAGISRTTAYRYFPNRRALIVAMFPEVDRDSLLPDPAPEGPTERLEILSERFTRQLLEHEPELRAQLRLSLEERPSDKQELVYRQGRAITWISEALEPLRRTMSEEKVHQLVLAIRATMGIEALVWLTDVAGVSRAEAVGIMRLSARRLVTAAMAEADHDP